jgi:hypothetical protein
MRLKRGWKWVFIVFTILSFGCVPCAFSCLTVIFPLLLKTQQKLKRCIRSTTSLIRFTIAFIALCYLSKCCCVDKEIMANLSCMYNFFSHCVDPGEGWQEAVQHDWRLKRGEYAIKIHILFSWFIFSTSCSEQKIELVLFWIRQKKPLIPLW